MSPWTEETPERRSYKTNDEIHERQEVIQEVAAEDEQTRSPDEAKLTKTPVKEEGPDASMARDFYLNSELKPEPMLKFVNSSQQDSSHQSDEDEDFKEQILRGDGEEERGGGSDDETSLRIPSVEFVEFQQKVPVTMSNHRFPPKSQNNGKTSRQKVGNKIPTTIFEMPSTTFHKLK